MILEVGTVVRRFLAMPRLLKPWFCPREAREGKMGSWQLSVGWRERVGERVGECVSECMGECVGERLGECVGG